MNKKTIKSVTNRILRNMMIEEKELRTLLKTETNNVPDRQLDGLFVKIEQLLTRISNNQNKIILLQDLKDEQCDKYVTHLCLILDTSVWRQGTGKKQK